MPLKLFAKIWRNVVFGKGMLMAVHITGRDPSVQGRNQFFIGVLRGQAGAILN